MHKLLGTEKSSGRNEELKAQTVREKSLKHGQGREGQTGLDARHSVAE